LQHAEQKWLKSILDARLALTLGSEVVFTSVVSDALKADTVVILGAASKAVFTGGPMTSDISCRGLIESYVDKTLITTWNLPDAIRHSQYAKEFLVDMLRARIYAYGLGNKNTGFVESISLRGEGGLEDRFSVETFESVITIFEQVLA